MRSDASEDVGTSGPGTAVGHLFRAWFRYDTAGLAVVPAPAEASNDAAVAMIAFLYEKSMRTYLRSADDQAGFERLVDLVSSMANPAVPVEDIRSVLGAGPADRVSVQSTVQIRLTAASAIAELLGIYDAEMDRWLIEAEYAAPP